jgi:hypothetical protein
MHAVQRMTSGNLVHLRQLRCSEVDLLSSSFLTRLRKTCKVPGLVYPEETLAIAGLLLSSQISHAILSTLSRSLQACLMQAAYAILVGCLISFR